MVNRSTKWLMLGAMVMVSAMACGAQPSGAELFADNCAQCHGAKADGTATGPPLVHRLYEPGHHADFAFQNAVQNGIVAHHWNFGDMPAVPGLSEGEVAAVIEHVRQLQRQAGIIK